MTDQQSTTSDPAAERLITGPDGLIGRQVRVLHDNPSDTHFRKGDLGTIVSRVNGCGPLDFNVHMYDGTGSYWLTLDEDIELVEPVTLQPLGFILGYDEDGVLHVDYQGQLYNRAQADLALADSGRDDPDTDWRILAVVDPGQLAQVDAQVEGR